MNCPLCKSSIKTTITTSDDNKYYHCQNCDLIYLNEAFRLNPPEEKSRYLLHNNTIENQGYVDMFNKFIDKAVIPFVKPGSIALDYGSGPGPVLKTLLERNGIQTKIYDPYFAPGILDAGEVFDLITCTEVIEHIYNPPEVWSKFGKQLKTGGILALRTEFHPGPDKFKNWWYKNDPTHVCFYSLYTFNWIEKNYPLSLIYNDNKNTLAYKKS